MIDYRQNIERKRQEEEEAERVRQEVAKGMTTYSREQTGRPSLEEIMAIEDSQERREASLDQLQFIAEQVRKYTGLDDISDYKKLTQLTLPTQGREALEKAIKVFTKNDVISDDEVAMILSGSEKEMKKAA
ncbi:MAG: hypothetical protein ABH846_03715 [Patescibacteria group bacterium]